MCKLFSFLFSIFFLFFSLHCEKKLIFTFGIGMEIGEMQEKVFEGNHLLSLLKWPTLPNFNLDINIDLFVSHFHFSFLTNIGIPSFAGHMSDSDYLNRLVPKKTLFSSHASHIKQNILLSSHIGFPFKVYPSKISEKKNISLILEPQIGFSFLSKKWKANGGYTQYKGDGMFWSPLWEKMEYKGDGVEYFQKLFFPFISFEMQLKLSKLSAFLRFLLSPFLFGTSKDIHFDRNYIFIDTFFLPSVAFEIMNMFEKTITKKLHFYTKIAFLFLYNRSGKTIIFKEKNIIASYPKGSAGIEGKDVKISAGFKIIF